MIRCRFALAIIPLVALVSGVSSVSADNTGGKSQSAASTKSAGDTSFEEANRAASSGRYERAVTGFERVIAREGFSPNVLLNLGKAHYRAGRVGHAILAWERGLLLAPQDPALETNLAEARRQHGLSAPRESEIEQAAHLLPMRRWLLIGAISLLVFCLGAALFQVLHRARMVLMPITVLSALTVTVSALSVWVGTLDTGRGVVLSDGSAIARISPFEDARPAYTLPEGDVVTVKEAHEEWIRVEDRAARSGWLPRAAVDPVSSDLALP